jgi:hypothetical protein
MTGLKIKISYKSYIITRIMLFHLSLVIGRYNLKLMPITQCRSERRVVMCVKWKQKYGTFIQFK